MTENFSRTVPYDWLQTIKKIGSERHSLHRNHSTSRPLSNDYEVVGLAGEYAFHDIFSVMADWSVRPEGDGGIDFKIGKISIDVKTARKPGNLIVEIGTVPADILILAGWNDPVVSLLGWEYGEVVLKSPERDFGYGIINHYIPARNLRPMGDLLNGINRWRSR
jgi:hypothetical protein